MVFGTRQWWWAAAIASVFFVGCSAPDEPPESGGSTSTTSQAPPATTTTSTIPLDPAAAFGAPPAVQDVILRFEMAVVTGDEERHVLDDVRDLAIEGTGTPLDLGSGIALLPSDSLTGTLVDADGAEVVGPRVDYGLLSVDVATLEETDRALRELADIESAGLDGPAALVVEIVTADFARGHTHASAGDRAVMDITAVEAVQPGDRLVQRYLFAQTWPGDPSEEEGLDPYQLFASRWRAGLVRVAGDENGPAVFEDATSDAAEGSTKAELEVKQALLVGTRLRGEVEGFQEARVVLSKRGAQDVPDIGEVEGVGGNIVMLYDLPGDPGDDGDQGPRQREVTTEEFTAVLSTLRGRQACLALLPEMLVRNRLAARLDDVGDAISRTGVGDETDIADVRRNLEGEPYLDDPSKLTIPSTLIDVCDPPPGPPDPPDFPDIPTGGTFGDIRLRTLDGLAYENQAVGEFVLFESPTTDVHIRTEPAAGSNAASVATATAVRLTSASLSMHLDGSAFLDGEPIDLARGAPTDIDGVAVVDSTIGWGIVFADGTQVRVDRLANQLVTVIVAATLPTGGMLGDGDQDPSDDLVGRDGRTVSVDEALGRDRESFYSEFVDSWRLDDEESILHHRSGESAEGFAVDDFPSQSVLLEDLDPDVRDEAAAACLDAGVRTADGLRDCTLDVAITGDPSFAFPTFLFEVATNRPIDDEPAGRPSAAAEPGTLVIGSTTIELGPDPSERVPSTPVNWSCTAIDGTFTLGQRYTRSATERYDVEILHVAPEASPSGQSRFTLIVERNGEPWAWVLDFIEPPPGSVESLSIDGSRLQASGTVFVNDPPDPTLSPLALVPDDGLRMVFDVDADCG